MKFHRTLAPLLAGLLLTSSFQAVAYEQGERFVRFGIAQVSPNDDSGDVEAFPGNGVSVDDDTGFGISFTHMYKNNWGLEVLGALPFSHDINGEGPTLSSLGKIASTDHLPPTFLLNYYPEVNAAGWHPYIGVGLNYTVFFDEKASDSLEAALGETDIELEDSLGLALQVGVDYDINEKWFVNAALWYIQIGTTADIEFAGGPATGGNAGETSVDVDIDPWVAMLGLGYRF